MSRKLLTSVAILGLATGLVACLEQGDSTQSKKLQKLAATFDPGLKNNVHQAKKTSDPFLTYVAKKDPLPAYKTEWEREFERRMAVAKADGIINADTYDDYRKNNFDKFFITKAPTTTSFRAVAEFEPSQAYILYYDNSTYYQTTAWKAYFNGIVKGAWGVVPVMMVYDNAAHKLYIETELKTLGYTTADLQDTTKIIWYKHEMDAIWSRDYGPVGLTSTGTTGAGTLSFVDFRYYHTRVHDDEIPTSIAKDWGINVYRPDLDFEPGNFMATSDGLCAATKGVLYANPQFTQSAVEQIFTDYMACKKNMFPVPMSGVIAHIDMFSKFGSDTAVMVAEYTATQDAKNKAILDANATLFAATTSGSGKTITVTRIPMPNNVLAATGDAGPNPKKTYRTYTNSVSLSNGTQKVLLIPTYSVETSNEAAAMAAYTKVFPGWTQVKVDSEIIIPGEGAVHCTTSQIPVGTKAKMETDPTHLCGAQATVCSKAICGNITSAGCCEGKMLKYCVGGKLTMEDCTNSPQCGWSTTSSYYDCGTAGSSDPSGKLVKNCGVLTDAPIPDASPDMLPTGCGNVSYEGCCDGGTVWYCDSSTLKFINCASNPKCGWSSSGGYYDCGTGGTADPTGKAKMSCAGAFGDAGAPATDGMATGDGTAPTTDGSTTGCGSITTSGCCEGEKVKYCQGGQLKTLDCTSNPKCGWDSTSSYYDCGTSGTADPSGTAPMPCTAPDGGTPDLPTPDQTVKADVFDANTAPDTSAVDAGSDAGNKDDDDGGCSCDVAAAPAGSQGWPLALLGLLIGLIRIRRRR